MANSSNTVFRKYVKAEGPKVSHLRIDLYYDFGGFNGFTYRNDSRGYYLSVTPVERCDRGGYVTESQTLFRGVKQLIKEVARKGASVAKEAEKIAMSHLNELVNYICTKENITLLEEININD